MTQKAPRYQFDREKFAAATCQSFLMWRSDQQVSASVSNYEKIALLRRHFFADIDALEKTGTVVLPAASNVSVGDRGSFTSRRRRSLLKGRY
jgi:hypothetical protein